MRKLLFFGILALFTNQTLFAQWIQNEALTGGSMINDIISYKGKIYAAISDNGLYSSSDNGDSWSHVDVGYDWTIDRLEVHKDQILAATSKHVFKSSDGINWEDITIEGSFVKEIYSDGDYIYLATLTGGVFKSIDDGINWIDINDELTSEGVEAFAKTNNILYAGKRDNTGIIFKSADDGQNWEEIIIEEDIWIKEIRANSDGIFINVTDYILYSNDNGLSWSNISGALTGHRITQLIAQEGILYANANGQIFYTIDNGGNWKSSQNYISGINCSALHINESNIFVGMWGGGVARNTIALDQEWTCKNQGLILNSIHRIGVLNDTVFVGTESTFVRISSDKGLSWTQEVDQYNLKGGNARYLTIYKNQVYVGSGGSGVKKRNIEINRWERVSEDLPSQLIEDLCSNEEYIFVAIDGEGIYRSDNPENGWIKKSNGVSTGVRKLYSSGENIFAGTWNGLFISNNNGESWNDISGDLPGKSINDVIYVDSTIIIATQNNGAFKSSNFGLDWENISAESIYFLGSYKKTIIKGSSLGNLATSNDLGVTWKIIDDGVFPKSYVTSIGFSQDYILVGFGRPGQGIWQRNIHEIFPPTIVVEEEDSSELVLREEDGIIIESDQQLTKETGEKLDSTSLYSLIKVYDDNSNEIEFEASIDSTAKKITIIISFPIDSEKYIVVIDSINNESGLRSAKFISQAYEFHKNAPPLLSNIQKTGFEKQKITISPDDFSKAFSDEENDPIEFLKIIKTPQNGVLYNNNVILEENATLTLKEIDKLVYEPNLEFIGEDSVVWNSFDGFDFSSENAQINLRINAITGLKDEEISNFLLYPNPAQDQITSIIQNNYSGTYRYILTNINGRVLKKFEIDKDSEKLDYSISLNGLTRGIYLLQINGNGFSTTQKVLKK